MRKIPLDKMPREIEKKRCQINKKEISENISNGSQCDGKSFVESGKILGDKRRGGGLCVRTRGPEGEGVTEGAISPLT